MNATIKTLKSDLAAGVSFCHAPSLSAAIRASAEKLVAVCILNGVDSSSDALAQYILGDISLDMAKVGNYYIVDFYKSNDTTPFAIVEVN